MPPPPPPPPAPPPPLPKTPLGGTNAQGKSNHSEPAPDRNALLSQIRKGARLKKVETNDRSTPLIEGNRSSSNNVSKQNTDTNKTNGPFPIIPPGGLFAQGIPKLRPTTPRSENNSNPPLSMVIQSIKQGNSNSSLRVNQLSKSRSQPPSPVSKLRTTTQSGTVNSENNANSSLHGGNPNFPDDITVKGPAPAPPPQSQKPVFRSTTNLESESTVKHSTVKRSASQTNLQRPRLARPPPSEKPPPPPKSSPAPPQNAPPPPPSKPPNIMRRQSFGVGESHNMRFASNKLSVANNNTAPKSNPKVIGPPPPPPPPRNNSAPNDLNQMSSSPGNHCVKMNIAPPPPPNRAAATTMRAGAVRPPPPRAPAPPPPPPPPPQHQAPVHPAPPSQMKAVPPPNLAPPPPARVSSIKQPAIDFEDRFKHMFCPAQSLPKPEKFTNFQKNYPSRISRQKTNTRRQPPPPPPQAGGRNNPVISVQYDSGIYSGNYEHS